MGKAHAEGLKRQTDNKFLNMYEIDAVRRDGVHFPYYIATRRETGDLMYETGTLRADGVVIYPVYRPDPGKLVVIRQFRYPVNGYIYEVPAGLVDAGEDPAEAAVREMKEETGLDFVPLKADEMFCKPLFSSIGMTDESVATVYGCSTGQVSREGLEDNEEIEVVLADRTEVRRILKEEKLSINCAYLLMHFLHHTEEDPFYFLHNE